MRLHGFLASRAASGENRQVRRGKPLDPVRAVERLVAIYHLNVKNISRGDGRSVVAAAAYRAGAVLPNEAEERLSDFGGRRDVVTSEIRLPAGAPEWMADRTRLWNAVEVAEKRVDARLAKEVEFALPRELPRSAWLTVARAMADAYAAQGFVADLAIHDDGTKHNPHVHIRGTNRELERALRTVTAGRTGRALRVLESRFDEYARLMFELGKVTGHIRELRGRGHQEEGHSGHRPEYEQDIAPATDSPVQGDDRLDWLRPVIDGSSTEDNVLRDARQDEDRLG